MRPVSFGVDGFLGAVDEMFGVAVKGDGVALMVGHGVTGVVHHLEFVEGELFEHDAADGDIEGAVAAAGGDGGE